LKLVIGRKAQCVALARSNPQNWLRAAKPETVLRCGEAFTIHKTTVELSNQITREARALCGQYPGVARNTRISAVLLITELLASIGDEIKGGFAVEDARFAALALDHVQDLFDDLDLVQTTLGPDR
jgi:hypothetical protein